MVYDMINSLFDKKTMKKFDDIANKQAVIANKQAILNDKKKELAKETMVKIEPATLASVFEIVKKYGHPSEQNLSGKIEQKYLAGEELTFDDLINLDNLYKSNYENFIKKDNCDE